MLWLLKAVCYARLHSVYLGVMKWSQQRTSSWTMLPHLGRLDTAIEKIFAGLTASMLASGGKSSWQACLRVKKPFLFEPIMLAHTVCAGFEPALYVNLQ